jgi:autoinducer 2-binding protein LuxP
LFAFFSQSFAEESSYWKIGEYFALHPEQAWKFDSFAESVRNQAVPLKKKNLRPLKIAVVYPAIQTSDYWKRNIYTFEKRLIELNINYTLLMYFSKPYGDARLQIEQIASALDNETDILVVSADNVQVRKVLGRVLTMDKPKVIIQNLTTPLKEWDSSQPMLYTGFDHVTGSELLADAMSTRVKEGNYAVLYCTQGSVSELRGESFINRMSSIGGYVPVARYYTDYDRKKSYSSVIDLFKSRSDIKFIFACSTDIALGAMDALKELGIKDKVVLNGWGGGAVELEAIRNKGLDLTVMRMNDDSGVAMAEAVKLLLEERTEDIPLIFSGDFHIVSGDNTQSEIDELSRKAFRYSKINEKK